MGGHPNKRTGGTPNKGQDNLTSVRCESDAGCPPLLGDPCVQCVGGLCESNHLCV